MLAPPHVAPFADGRPSSFPSQYIYVGLLLTCLLLSLGNRPRGAKRWYRGAIYGFGALQVWLLVCSILVLIKASQQFGERTFTQMIVSVAATFGVSRPAAPRRAHRCRADPADPLARSLQCWVVASCLALDPWHLVTSSLGYLLLSVPFPAAVERARLARTKLTLALPRPQVADVR